jgi:hypothetical protein
MKTATKSIASIFAAIAVIGTAIWFYFTPHLVAQEMASAAEERNATKLSLHINFPSLRESVKAGVNAKLASELLSAGDPDNPFAALGLAIGTALVNPIVDAIVTPEGVASIMRGERPTDQKGGKGKPTSNESDIDTSVHYESFDRFVVAVKKAGSSDDPFLLVFHRDGLLGWKLSELRFPERM